MTKSQVTELAVAHGLIRPRAPKAPHSKPGDRSRTELPEVTLQGTALPGTGSQQDTVGTSTWKIWTTQKVWQGCVTTQLTAPFPAVTTHCLREGGKTLLYPSWALRLACKLDQQKTDQQETTKHDPFGKACIGLPMGTAREDASKRGRDFLNSKDGTIPRW